MSSNTVGWAVVLQGEQFDLDDCREQLNPPFDPWVEEYQTNEGVVLLLRSSTWTKITEVGEVFQDAARIIDQLNGAALLIHNDAKPLEPGQVMKFRADGKRDHFILAASGHAKLTLGRLRVRGRGKVITGGHPGTPSESILQKWLKQAELNDTRAGLFVHLNRADNWYDLYKSMELARRLVGGQKALKTALGPDWNEWHRAWKTANCYRHAPDPLNYPLPNPPAEWEDARSLILRMIPRVL